MLKDSDTAEPLNKNIKAERCLLALRSHPAYKQQFGKSNLWGFPHVSFQTSVQLFFLKSLSKVLSLNLCSSFIIEALDTPTSFGMWSQKGIA